ncbi:MAG TPA: choice-of-anchor Q domain-containing protein, partial [Candidatus Acidoferrales bacterium]|nr:choice-of-anchor Q domain-containing protein [Candidatus Acidoferrales bacterium]
FSTVTITNSTFSGNSAPDTAGGGADILSFSTTLTVTNTIVANSTAGGNCARFGGSVTDGGHNLDDGTTCGFTGAGCTTTSGSSFCLTNPVLDPTGVQNNGGPTQTIALCTGTGAPRAGCTGASPAINAGDESVCATTTGTAPVDNLDQRGFVRPGTGAANCSIGAFEANSTPPPPTSTPTNTPTPTATATPSSTGTSTPTASPPPVPVMPSPISPAGLSMISLITLCMVWLLRTRLLR